MAYLPLEFLPLKTPPKGIRFFTIFQKPVSYFVDNDKQRWFGLALLATACDCTEDFLIELIQEQYRPYLRDAFCVTPHRDSKIFIAEPCFVYLMYTLPRCAHIRRWMEKASYPGLKWKRDMNLKTPAPRVLSRHYSEFVARLNDGDNQR